MKSEYLQHIREVLHDFPDDKSWLVDYRGYCIEMVRYVDQLIAEVERQQLIISGKTQCDERKAAAMRCAEICEEMTKYLSCSKDGHGIADAIRKEFNLET